MKVEARDIAIPTIATAGLLYGGYRLLSHLTTNEEDWVPVGRVKDIFIHPVKSCRGNKVFSAKCEKRGLSTGEIFDRQFVVYDTEQQLALIGKTTARLVLINCDVRDGRLHMTAGEDRVNVVVEHVLAQAKISTCRFYDNKSVEGYDCGDEAAEFLAKVLENPNVRLLYFDACLKTERDCISNPLWWNNNPVPKRHEKIRYQNTTPYMICTQASLDAFNEKLREGGQDEVVIRNLRPNVLVEGPESWDEDRWSDVRIGDVQLKCFRPCNRCPSITVNPENAERDQRILEKLKEFRSVEGQMKKVFGNAGIFGVQAGCDREGYICEGDVVWVKYKKERF